MELIAQADITCPYCGEEFALEVDTSQSEQTLIEDCTVCCRPISLTIQCRPGMIVDLSNTLEPFAVGQMDDQRIKARSPLRFENFCDGDRIERVSGQAVNGFGWQRNDFAFA